MTTNHSKEGRPRNGTTFFDTDSTILAEPDATQRNSEPHSKWAADLERRARRCLHDPEYRDMQPQYVRDRTDEIRSAERAGLDRWPGEPRPEPSIPIAPDAAGGQVAQRMRAEGRTGSGTVVPAGQQNWFRAQSPSIPSCIQYA